ncbi:hypothetical protein ABH944_001181 [Caballeronia udeis]|uniref:Uncharacterized protein n=1 Tax=Caballeronia udeis TaxID=1232866 RepID=A0ABW8MCH3_9BURK
MIGLRCIDQTAGDALAVGSVIAYWQLCRD